MKLPVSMVRSVLAFVRHPELRDPSLALHPSGEFISDRIRKTRTYYEIAELLHVQKKFDTSRFIDIGANIGNHSHFFSTFGSTGWAFEPVSKNFELLELNAPAFSCAKVALSDTTTTSEIAVFESCMGNSHLIANFGQEQTEWGTGLSSEMVPVRTLDSFEIDSPSLVKIDVEGSELAVLRGARMTLSRFKPVIWIELHTEKNLKAFGFPYRRQDVFDELSIHGYSRVEELNPTNFVFAANLI